MVQKDRFPDYLLIKDLPGGYKAGCIFSIGENYLYYISYDPSDHKDVNMFNRHITDSSFGVYYHRYEKFNPEKDAMMRFNIHQISNDTDWFLEITPQLRREMQINKIMD